MDSDRSYTVLEDTNAEPRPFASNSRGINLPFGTLACEGAATCRMQPKWPDAGGPACACSDSLGLFFPPDRILSYLPTRFSSDSRSRSFVRASHEASPLSLSDATSVGDAPLPTRPRSLNSKVNIRGGDPGRELGGVPGTRKEHEPREYSEKILEPSTVHRRHVLARRALRSPGSAQDCEAMYATKVHAKPTPVVEASRRRVKARCVRMRGHRSTNVEHKVRGVC